MKKVILLALFVPSMACGQIVESFESGNLDNWLLNTEGQWKADSIESISGKFSLHHIYDNPDAGTDQAGIPIGDLHPAQGLTRWSFLVRHGYDPSSSNNWSAFLMSDAEPAAMSSPGITNGFAVGVNLTGTDDTLRLWKVKGSQVTTIIDSRINWQTVIGITDPVKIIVERSQTGIWFVSVSRLNGTLIGSASGFDNELFNTAWFGIYYEYSSSRDRLLWIDDIIIDGIFYKDSEAPVISGCEMSGKNSIDIIFNEEPAAESMVPANFLLIEHADSSVYVTKLTSLIYRVGFNNIFVNKTLNILKIFKICDKSGNCASEIIVPFTPVWVEPGNVIISEIMADPMPEISLPGKEYLELINRTEYSFNIRNWKLLSEDQSYLLPEANIQSSGILILCLSQDTSLFSKYGKVTGLKQFPSLTDGGRLLVLADSTGNLIHGVEYSAEWYGTGLKSGGGWSLEMIDTSYPFNYEGNWTASESRKGGTPGSINSVAHSNPDNSFYGIQNVFPDDSNSITVRFSEPVFDLPENVNSIEIGGKSINDLYPTDKLFRIFHINLTDPLIEGDVIQLDISGDINDFAGNGMQIRNFKFGLPELPGPGDILFNEILFNPLPGDPDYIELFNSSEKVIDASRLQLVSVNSENRDTSQIFLVSAEKRCVVPDSYYAFTTDRQKISNRYFSADPEFLFETGSLPSMSDDEGHLVLFNRELDLIDAVFYNEDMHYSLLSGSEGIALEKAAPLARSEDKINWHSASESSGWGTPGAPNSVFSELPAVSDKVALSSSKITPDNDGYEDILVIGFNFAGNGNVVSVTVFDETGNYVKKIVENMLSGPEASVIWDGTADDDSLVQTGIYIIFITMYDDTGKTNKWKKVCTVIRK